MTIREYIKIHTEDSYINNYCIVIKPFSVCGKNHKEQQEAMQIVFNKQKENGIRLTEKVRFYSIKELAKKVDFSIEVKRVKVGYDSSYSYDAEPETTFYIEDTEFLKIAKSCEDM